MDIRRLVLFSALSLVGLSLWNAWQADYPVATQPTHIAANTTSASNASSDALLPQTNSLSHDSSAQQTMSTNEPANLSAELIHVKTDVLDIAIDLAQGDIVGSDLLDFPLSVEDKEKPFALLQNQPNDRYVANSSLITSDGQTTQTVNLNFKADQQNYQLASNEKELTVVLHGQTAEGLQVDKQFIFTQGTYLIKVAYQIINNGTAEWKGYLNTQLLRASPKEDKSSMFHVGSYTGASFSNPEKKHYQKVSFSDMEKGNLGIDVKGGWVSMQQHYFLSAWIPQQSTNNMFYTRSMNDNYTIGFLSQPIVVNPTEKKDLSVSLYVGPETISILKGVAPFLDLTVDYGMLWFVSSLLFSLMKAIYSVIGNWGWSIVLVTVLIKLAFYRLSATSYKSMANMRKLQPKLQALRERYGDDKAKISQATMELYRQEKVNPLGGCLPIVIQIPVFIALYWVLLESVELRQAPFLLWINDLASPDPFHVLPLIMGVTMLIQQKLNPAPPDPVQAKVMMFLPLFFTALFWNFPSGLVLYWTVNNTLSILQQWYITRKYSDDHTGKKLAVTAK